MILKKVKKLESQTQAMDTSSFRNSRKASYVSKAGLGIEVSTCPGFPDNFKQTIF